MHREMGRFSYRVNLIRVGTNLLDQNVDPIALLSGLSGAALPWL
jgi:hypothetical protein